MTKDLTPPYFAVIFTSISKGHPDYDHMAERMVELSSKSLGFLGMHHARSELGITICYWENEESIQRWKERSEHQIAQKLGVEKFYSYYRVQVAEVTKAYEWSEKK